jgi:aminoglycoside phosphotransferase (APT) family kinase protein
MRSGTHRGSPIIRFYLAARPSGRRIPRPSGCPTPATPLACSAAVTQNLSVLGGLVDRRAVMRVWEAVIVAPTWDRSPVWLHGDLHHANILVHRGRISGVIDFGDITSGDPATDLSVAWMLLPAECHDASATPTAQQAGTSTQPARTAGREPEAGRSRCRSCSWPTRLTTGCLRK